jgi:hypothetical protein
MTRPKSAVGNKRTTAFSACTFALSTGDTTGYKSVSKRKQLRRHQPRHDPQAHCRRPFLYRWHSSCRRADGHAPSLDRHTQWSYFWPRCRRDGRGALGFGFFGEYCRHFRSSSSGSAATARLKQSSTDSAASRCIMCAATDCSSVYHPQLTKTRTSHVESGCFLCLICTSFRYPATFAANPVGGLREPRVRSIRRFWLQ